MYCRNCGEEIGEAKFCPKCGTPQTETAGAAEPFYDGYGSYGNDVTGLYRTMFKDPLFLVVCVLMTVSAVLSSVKYSSSSGKISISLGILSILYVIALWLIFSAARSSEGFSGTGLAMASGVVKATYIIVWVAVGVIAVAAVALALAGPSVLYGLQSVIFSSGNTSIYGPIDGLEDIGPDLEGLLQIRSGAGYVAIGIIVVMVIGLIAVILINLFFIRNLHKFTKSVCVSREEGVLDIQKADTSRKWLLVMGILSAIGFAGSIGTINGYTEVTDVVATGCSAAASIVASVLIKKYFANR